MIAGDILTSGGQHPDRAMVYPPTLVMIHDAQVLATRVTLLLQSYLARSVGKSEPATPHTGEEPKVRSGYRPPEVNAKTPGAAKNSNHMACRAVDLEDPKQHLSHWCLANLDLLAHFELWLEDPRFTPSWCHLQSVPPRSLSRVFQP